MIESGSMLFNGRRCGSLVLKIQGPNFFWFSEAIGKNTLDDAIFDARYKLDECIASRSPVEAEIAFLNHWLSLAEVPPTAIIDVVEVPPLGSASSNKIVPISKVEFSTLEVPEINEDPEYPGPVMRK